MFVYVGCYTEPGFGSGQGISVFALDAESGHLTLVQTVPEVENPSYLAFGAARRHLYAVEEVDEGRVCAFSRDPETGRLTLLNRQASQGAAPCHLSLDGSGRSVVVANYGSGSVAALPITADGRLDPATGFVRHAGASVHPDRQVGPHAHMIVPDPGGRLMLATDLGTDQIHVYRLDETGRLLPNDRGAAFARTAPGDGPRHLAFGLDGRRVYVINELASTVTMYDYDGERGELRARQTVSTLPEGFDGETTCAHVALSPDGAFLYGSNRGHDSIAIWAVDPASGELTSIGHEPTRGREPRNFAFDPTGAWLLAANQHSDTIVAFRRDPATGVLTVGGQVTRTLSPVAILIAGE